MVSNTISHFSLPLIKTTKPSLSFFLVDMFFLKTCSFNGVEPRLFNNRLREGLFCLETPMARFALTPCQKPSCLCCHSPCPRRDTTAIQFSLPHIHRFVNQYEAILNCPAVCCCCVKSYTLFLGLPLPFFSDM